MDSCEFITICELIIAFLGSLIESCNVMMKGFITRGFTCIDEYFTQKSGERKKK